MNWWHTFDFPEFTTKGLDNSPEKLEFIKMPEDLTGWSVLDIGAWDGYFSFVAEKRGATDVFAVDSPLHAWANHRQVGDVKFEVGKEGFETARKALNSKVVDVECELDELKNITWKKKGWDLVLCLGILYHTKDPYKLIRELYEITNKVLILETHIDVNEAPFPIMRFYSNKEVNNDEGTIWGPNMLCVYEMLRKVGFKNIVADYNGRGVFRAEK